MLYAIDFVTEASRAKSGNEPAVIKPAVKDIWGSLRSVKAAVRGHRMAFPSQVPVFKHLQRTDIQWRIVLLYFVRGWSSPRIAERYGVTKERVVQLLRQWTEHAILRGYLDRIPSEKECAALPAPRWNQRPV